MSQGLRVVRALPATLRDPVRRVLAAADARDVRVYLVGGPVRDHLLGRPVRDVDLVVEPRGRIRAPQLARAARARGERVVAHERFGTARIEAAASRIDLTTARSESYAHPGALPAVAPGSLEDDLRRRDFSVNALAMPLSRAACAEHARIVDPFGGQADLVARRLRILHPRSFHDDPTRALRAARLAPRLGFRLSPDSRRALSEALAAGCLDRVSGERLRAELEKVFADAPLGLEAPRALELARRWGLLHALQPRLHVAGSARRELRRLHASLVEPPWSWEALRAWVPGFALWLAGVPADARRRVLARLSLQGAIRERLEAFPRWRARLTRSLRADRRPSAVDRRLGGIPDEWLLALHAGLPLDARRRIERFARQDRGCASWVTGDDLLRLGISGPALGAALARLRAAQLDGQLRSRAEALERARVLARGPSA